MQNTLKYLTKPHYVGEHRPLYIYYLFLAEKVAIMFHTSIYFENETLFIVLMFIKIISIQAIPSTRGFMYVVWHLKRAISSSINDSI